MEHQEQVKKKWYVVRAISGKEKKAKEYIESEVAKRNWQDYVSQVLIPTEKVVSLRNGKKVIKDRNLFPGYVLIEADLSKEEVIPVIQSLPNVIDFLCEKDDRSNNFNGRPIPMRPDEIASIIGAMDEQNEMSATLEECYLEGETVKIIDGPFNTFSGIVEEVNNERKRMKVVVTIFGRKTAVELNFNQVEKE